MDSCCLTEAAPPIIRISDQSSRKFCDSSDTRSTLSLWKGFFRGCLEGKAIRQLWAALNTRDGLAMLQCPPEHTLVLKLAGSPKARAPQGPGRLPAQSRPLTTPAAALPPGYSQLATSSFCSSESGWRGNCHEPTCERHRVFPGQGTGNTSGCGSAGLLSGCTHRLRCTGSRGRGGVTLVPILPWQTQPQTEDASEICKWKKQRLDLQLPIRPPASSRQIGQREGKNEIGHALIPNHSGEQTILVPQQSPACRTGFRTALHFLPFTCSIHTAPFL